ncbi:site-specific integrase [Ralstonia wenshanensis]|uniref:hypothetical protein n=1 Tax=Ralstonia wenshanensis TaxID=2842456 RepID=UPI0021B16162|nr:hypothetical protein [Ralstonia wenshanensis]MCT7307119.1 hypothetical protein [Ralstonia wenshanensis]
MTSNVVSLLDAALYNIPAPTASNPFAQVEWIFHQRLSRVRSESGKDNYRYALSYYLKFLRETHGESPYILRERWDTLAMARFKAWLLTREKSDSSQFGSHTTVGIVSSVRQAMNDAVNLGFSVSHSILNAPMPIANRSTETHDPYTDEELVGILEAVRKDMEYTSAVLKGYEKTGVGRDPQARPRSDLRINPRDYAKHGYGWNSEDNLRWYFENRMNCRAMSRTDPEAKDKHKAFLTGANRYHGGYLQLYKRWGVAPQIDRDVLCPLLIQLSYLTGLNPYSLTDLSVNCVAEHPLTGTPVLRYFKLRSGGEKELLIDLLNDKSQKQPPEFDAVEIPLKREHALLVQRTVSRILRLTQSLRERKNISPELKNLLFIYESSGNNCHGQLQSISADKANIWCGTLAKRHNLKSSSGSPLTFTLVRFRPTRLTEMASQGKDFFEIQHVAGHKSITQTLAYIEKRTFDSVAEREITTALEKIWSNREEFSVNTEKTGEVIEPRTFKGLLANCKNVFDPPRAVQLSADYTPGRACTRFNMCLFCKNIVLMKEHLPVLAHYRNQLRANVSKTGSDLPHTALYEKTLAVLDQIFDPETSEFGEQELDDAVEAAEYLDIVIDPLVYPGGAA